MKKLKGREILLMILPVVALVAIALSLGQGESPPVIAKMEITPMQPGEPRSRSGKWVNGKMRYYVEDTKITVFVRYRAPHFYTRMWGWKQGEALSWETENNSFYNQSGQGLGIKASEGGLEYRGNDLFSISYEFSSAEIPKSAGRTTFKMRGIATNDKGKTWFLSASAVVRP